MKNMSINSEVPNPPVWYRNQVPTTSTKSEQVRKSKVFFVANPFLRLKTTIATIKNIWMLKHKSPSNSRFQPPGNSHILSAATFTINYMQLNSLQLNSILAGGSPQLIRIATCECRFHKYLEGNYQVISLVQ